MNPWIGEELRKINLRVEATRGARHYLFMAAFHLHRVELDCIWRDAGMVMRVAAGGDMALVKVWPAVIGDWWLVLASYVLAGVRLDRLWGGWRLALVLVAVAEAGARMTLGLGRGWGRWAALHRTIEWNTSVVWPQPRHGAQCALVRDTGHLRHGHAAATWILECEGVTSAGGRGCEQFLVLRRCFVKIKWNIVTHFLRSLWSFLTNNFGSTDTFVLELRLDT